MNLDSIRIVLIGTTHPGNIGAAARAMKTMGLSKLYLVSPKIFPDFRAHEMAAGADDVLQQAIVTDSLADAIKDCHLILGTSARPRGISLPGLTPSTQADLVCRHAADAEVAILFGREHAGLTNEELLHCHYHINIPSNPEYSSLNLAQAVQIIAYELRMKWLQTTPLAEKETDKPATHDEMERFYNHLQDVLVQIDFLKLSNPKRLLQRLRRLFNRIKLEHTEVNILRGILTHVQYALSKARLPANAEARDAPEI
ncbi:MULTISPECIES: RNA methyltransferase [Legionella]|uniref:tRNA (cytidine/uridine-2'-O-)-methyltransferase TrmJ n=1 Tax=Legionella septentrionalis TaxID=2498109 RepID=A0A433JKC2_9GAMM|nr:MULTISPECIES: RNA methyltransferase [Legionella]MCP0914310.1 RNA methyltransferase [Legionella sp. 27cVA30]RUQ89029.1 RNA methyltransferase [Legionella septentrionalis]RUR00336.1 RNA methyltransferase [Legionella septentrionalis]RUR11807.1 RNA methyltransferase [Legionella septentrionalis]RUR17495.1 RNA methyltransferase [Legionella septentrionalis]